MISVRETTLQDIEVMRMEHIRSLPEFQDLFLELQIPYADVMELSYNGNSIGYTIIKGRVMLEFFILGRFQSNLCVHFPSIVKTCGIDTILVQSYDRLLMMCCSRLYPYQVVGLLYRDFNRLEIPKNVEISFRSATLSDLPFLLMQEDEVFEPKDRLPVSLENGEIIICLNGEKIVGCGFITRIHPLWNYYDVGVWVNPTSRMHGYGTQIICRLTETCDNNCWIPICGCGIENPGSRRILEKNGFNSNHHLLAFEVNA